MAKIDIVMPQMGESITTGTITKWHKQAGDTIKLDEILFEISTDKVESEIPSPFAGRVEQILYPEGTTVDVGKPIAVIEDDLSAAPSAGKSAPAPQAQAPKSAPHKEVPTSTRVDAIQTPAAQDDGERRFYTPLVKKLAQDAGVPLAELNKIKGTGAGNRVNREDFEKYLSTRGSKPTQIHLNESAPAPVTSASTAPAPKVADGYKGKTEIIPMDNMRKAIAKNMIQSKLTSPHVNSVDEIDMSKLVKFRESFKAEFSKQEGFNLTYTPFILYALIQALKEHPRVNASLDGDNIILKKDINIGCAVAVPGNGLVVPVIQSADNLNMLGLCRQLDTLAKKARNKKLTMDELTGGTFTFTNVGSFGTLFATPVILQPQLGIFAAGVIKKRLMVGEDDSIVIRSMMYGTHTYDHRLVDGELGGQFLASAKKHLENMDTASLF